MPLNQYGLGILFTGKDMATGVVDKVGTSMTATAGSAKALRDQFTQSAKKMATGAAMIGGGLKALGGLNRLVGEFAGFQSVVASSAAIAGASEKGYRKLFLAAQKAGIETMFAPRQAALGLRVLSQAGLDVQDSVKALIPALNLATASFGQLGPEQTAGLVTIAMKTFGIAADDVGDAVGRMVHATNTAKMSIGDLELGLAGASRGSLALKQSLSETLISLGLIKNAGFRTQRAATSLSMAMARVATPKTQKALEKLNITVTDGEDRFRPFLDVIQDVTSATATMTDKKKAAWLQDVFGMEALGGLLAIMNQLTKGIKTSTGETVKGAAAIEHMRSGMEGAGGAADLMSRKFLATMEGQLKLMKGSLDTLKITLGAVFAKTFLPVVQAVTKVLNVMIVTVEKLPAPIKDLIATLAPLAGVAVVVSGLAKSFRGLLGMMAATKAATALSSATAGAAGSVTALNSATAGLTKTAGMASVAAGGLAMSAQQNAQAFGVVAPTFRRVTTEGDLMLAQMRKQHIGVSKLSRLTGGLGSVLRGLPFIAAGAALGVWIGKMIAAHSATARKTAALKRLNVEYKLQLKSIKETRTTLAKVIRLHRSESEEMLKLSRGIKTKKDARIAETKATELLTKQARKVLSLEERARELSGKAKRSREAFDAATAKGNKFRLESGTDIVLKEEIAARKRMVLDKIASTQAINNFKLEKAAHTAMVKGREVIVAKLTAFELSKTQKGSQERLKVLRAMTFLAAKEHLKRKKARRAAAEALVKAQEEGKFAVIKSREDALAKTEKAERVAAAKMKALVKRGQATGILLGLDPEKVKELTVTKARAAAMGVTAPTIELEKTIRRRRVEGITGPTAPAQTMTEFVQQPIVAMQTALSNKLDKMIEIENKVGKLLGEQQIVINVTVGDKVITKSVNRGKGDEEESKGGVLVRKVGGAGGPAWGV